MASGNVTEEENPSKKEKKHKKGQKLLASNHSVNSDEKKEKKKKKKVDEVLLKDECGYASEEKEKTKQKKRKAESVGDAEYTNGEAPTKKKKKNKGALAGADNFVGPLKCTVENEKKIKQKKKNLKNKSVQDKQKKMKVDDQQGEEMCDSAAETEVPVQAKKKKKIKKEKTSPTVNGTNNSNLKKNKKVTGGGLKEDASDTGEKKGNVKKKKKGCSQSDGERNAGKKKPTGLNAAVKEQTAMAEVEDVTRPIAPSEEETVQKEAKKKKKRKATADGEECEEKLVKSKSKNTDPDEGKINVKKTTKEDLSNATVEPREPKKKKRVKKNDDCKQIEEEVQPSRTKKKKKKESCDGEEKRSRAAKRKKKDIWTGDSQESSDGDVVFLSEKSGNIDEVTINQERRQALQNEVDAASQPQKPAQLTGFGQWSTAQFDSSEKQKKFLRLMGGFKKSFQPMTSSVGAANMALGKAQQQQLQQGLLGEFDRAHSRRMDFSIQAAGLGYSAPSKNKFSIDINAHRSIRFDEQ